MKIIKSDPAVQNVMAFTGGHRQHTNAGFVYWLAKASRSARCQRRRDRQSPAPQAGRGARSHASSCRPQDLRVGGRQTQRTISIHDSKRQCGGLDQWGPILLQEMRKLPGLTDVNTDQQNSGLEASLVYDRETASRLGISPQLSTTLCMTPLGSAKSRRCTRS